MASKKHDTMAATVPIKVNVPLDVIARIKNDDFTSFADLQAILTPVTCDMFIDIKAMPHNITPAPKTEAAPPSITPSTNEHFTINVRSPTMPNLKLDMRVNANTTMDEVKSRIQDSRGIPPDQQRLIASGLQLEDNRTLGDYGLGEGSLVYVVLRLRGS